LPTDVLQNGQVLDGTVLLLRKISVADGGLGTFALRLTGGIEVSIDEILAVGILAQCPAEQDELSGGVDGIGQVLCLLATELLQVVQRYGGTAVAQELSLKILP
jgi:hypothetical protein